MTEKSERDTNRMALARCPPSLNRNCLHPHIRVALWSLLCLDLENLQKKKQKVVGLRECIGQPAPRVPPID